MQGYRISARAAIVGTGLCWLLGAVAQGEIIYFDLESKMNRKLTDNLGSGAEGNTLGGVPVGEQNLDGAKFKTGPGLLQLGSTFLDGWPDKIEGLPVEGKFARLNILHGTCYGRGKMGDAWFVKDGTLIGQYLVHFEDGSVEAIPIIYGEDVRDWWCEPQPLATTRGKVAWTGTNAVAAQYNADLRLFHTNWTNPKPDKKIVGVDYVARKGESPAAPFCLAISGENGP